MAGILTSVQLIGTAELSNSGNAFFVSDSLITPAEDYLALPVLTKLANVLVTMSSANVPTNYANYLAQLTATNCPALTDAIPSAYVAPITAAWGNNYSPIEGFMTGIVLNLADLELGNGDASIFGQIFGGAVGYVNITNQYINTVKNAQTFSGTTFTTMNSTTTGSLTDVNAATKVFGGDISRLGNLINLNNLDNFGSPLALIQQLTSIAAITPSLTTSFTQVGITTDIIDRFDSPDLTLSDTVQSKMYQAMQLVKGDDLKQVLQIFGIIPVANSSGGFDFGPVPTTPHLGNNVRTMADLLNPKKLFPNSYLSLTVKTFSVLEANSSPGSTNVLRAIYNPSGAVNTNLLNYLPKYVLIVSAP
jgi:hypothetical protein